MHGGKEHGVILREETVAGGVVQLEEALVLDVGQRLALAQETLLHIGIHTSVEIDLKPFLQPFGVEAAYRLQDMEDALQLRQAGEEHKADPLTCMGHIGVGDVIDGLEVVEPEGVINPHLVVEGCHLVGFDDDALELVERLGLVDTLLDFHRRVAGNHEVIDAAGQMQRGGQAYEAIGANVRRRNDDVFVTPEEQAPQHTQQNTGVAFPPLRIDVVHRPQLVPEEREQITVLYRIAGLGDVRVIECADEKQTLHGILRINGFTVDESPVVEIQREGIDRRTEHSGKDGPLDTP